MGAANFCLVLPFRFFIQDKLELLINLTSFPAFRRFLSLCLRAGSFVVLFCLLCVVLQGACYSSQKAISSSELRRLVTLLPELAGSCPSGSFQILLSLEKWLENWRLFGKLAKI